MGLIIGAVFWLKAALWFEKTKTYATYFNVSVKGLQRDAPVDYLGVPVGRVEKLTIAPDGRLVQVLLKLKKNFKVDSSVCAQLHVQGLTGLNYLEIGPAPKDIDRMSPKIDFLSSYPVIRSYPSEIDILEVRLEDVFAQFKSLDIQKLTDSWEKTSGLANNILLQLGAKSAKNGDLKATLVSLKHASQNAETLLATLSHAASPDQVNRGVKDLTASLASVKKITESLKRQLSTLQVGKLASGFNKTLESGNAVFSNLGGKIDTSAFLLDRDLREMGSLISQLKSFARAISLQPNSLVFPIKEPKEPFSSK
jgi:phospholipid/cholesterol/gamma-HCH transport system substrate-binding protein